MNSAIHTRRSETERKWIDVSLDDLGELYCGQSPSSATVNAEGVGEIYVTGPEQWDGQKIISEKWTTDPKRIAPDGSIFITVKGSVGEMFRGDRCAIGRDIYAFKPSDQLNFDFVFWAIREGIQEVIAHAKGDIPGISKDHLLSHHILLPGRKTQDRTVQKLEQLFSELDKGIDSLKTAHEQLRAYRQAVLKYAFEGKLTAEWREENRDKLESPGQLLERLRSARDSRYTQQLEEWKTTVIDWETSGNSGPKPRKPTAYKQPGAIGAEEQELLPAIPCSWRYVRLSQVAMVGSGMSVSAARRLDNPIEVSYLRVANVQRGFLDLNEIKSMRIEKSQLPALQLKHWDVLFNEGGDRDKLGRGWIWQSEVEPCITQNHVFRASLYIPFEEGAKLLSHWGNIFGQRYFEETGKQTTNLASINKTVLSEFPVPLIPHDEQIEICRQLDRIMTLVDAQEAEIGAALERAKLTYLAVLKRAFSGRLVEQDPNDEPASVLLERIKAQKDALAEKAKQDKNRKKKSKKAKCRKDAA